MFDGEVGGDDQRNSGDGGNGGQYVIRRDNDGEMERVLEKKAELIGKYEDEKKAQTDWERQFNGNQSSPKKVKSAETWTEVKQQFKSDASGRFTLLWQCVPDKIAQVAV